MTIKDMTAQQYYGQINDTEDRQVDAEKWLSSFTYSFEPALQKGVFRPWSTLCSTGGRRYETMLYLTASRKTTLAISPELKECATRPQPVATLSRWEHSKRLRTASWNYHCFRQVKSMIVYTDWREKKKKSKINASGVGWERFGVVEWSTHDLKR